MKSNQATLNTSTASLSSYSGSTSSLADRKPTATGSNEAMPAIRARLAKSGATLRASGATRPSGSGPGYTHGHGTPHQNPVLMVQEMVGRVKVTLYTYVWSAFILFKSCCTVPATYYFVPPLCYYSHFFIALVIGSAFGILPFFGDASLATASIVLDFHSWSNAILRLWKSVGITTRIA